MTSHETLTYPPVVVRATEAEYLPAIGHLLLADAGATNGALSTHRVQLGRGADGAVMQDRFDTHFVDSPAWDGARAH